MEKNIEKTFFAKIHANNPVAFPIGILLLSCWTIPYRVSNSFNSVKVTELPPVLERVANSAYHLYFCCLLRYVCPSFLLMFGIWVLIWQVPEVSFLL